MASVLPGGPSNPLLQCLGSRERTDVIDDLHDSLCLSGPSAQKDSWSSIRRRRPRSALLAPATALAILLATSKAGAVDPFEIQVYDGTANPPGVPGLELHVNTVVAGLTSSPSPPEYPENHQSHFTLEPSLGLFAWWEIGGYFEAALRGDRAFDYAGVKLRNKFVTPPNWNPRWRLGLNGEFSILPQGYDRSRWGN
jgi:hypothetical protein